MSLVLPGMCGINIIVLTVAFAYSLAAGGSIIVPEDLAGQDRRFLIRFLLADGQDVLILQSDGVLRRPTDADITTPPPSPSQPQSSATGAPAAQPSMAGVKRTSSSRSAAAAAPGAPPSSSVVERHTQPTASKKERKMK